MPKLPPYYYESHVKWTGQRRGELSSSHFPAIQVATPPEFHGHQDAWSPEHLYVASVNACFMTAFLAIAERTQLGFASFNCDAVGKLEKTGSGALDYQITEITLKPTMVFLSDADRQRGTEILEQAKRDCFITNSIKTLVKIEPNLDSIHEINPTRDLQTAKLPNNIQADRSISET